MIENERIEAIKQGIDLKAYIESCGIKLTKNGKGYFGLCPFHQDTNPSLSVTPEKQVWHCFGCGKSGNVIQFVQGLDHITFQQAIEKLDSTVKTIPTSTTKPTLTVKDQKLLAKVVSYYQHTLSQDQRGLNYLKNDRGITHLKSIKAFGTGFVNGNLLDILPHDEDIISSLKKIGILNAKGHEIFYNCVVFPLYNLNGTIVNLYGRNIDDTGPISHLYLPGPRSGLVNRQAVKRSSSIILTESIIDALTLYDQGFKNVIPAYGVNGLTEDHLFLFNRQIKEAYIAFDADPAGKTAADKLKAQLKEKEMDAHIVNLPEKDINIFFKRHTIEEFEVLLKTANPKSLEQSETLAKRSQTLYQETEQGFMVGYADRQYQIKGIQKSDTQLKITIKVGKDLNNSNQPFELSTIDLYSSRSRLWFAKLCVDLLSATEELIREDLTRIMNLVEAFKPKTNESTIPEATQAEKQRALQFLENPNLFDEILADLETLGITGENTNKLISYLSAISRKLDDPLSVLVQSRSAAGKSTLQDAILSLVPDEDYVKYTRITDQALFYKDEDSLVHKILAIEEEEGMGGAAYSIRNIQSSKKITVAATGKDPGTGKMRTEEYTVKGPVCVMITTTAADLEGETASRFIFLTIDESTQMTSAIHSMQRQAETLEGLVKKKQSETIIKKHHTAQRMLKPLAVVNPYSQYLSYPDQSIRTRRDHKKYLGLIRAIAFVYQYQRKIKSIKVDGKNVEYIEVTLEDIDRANTLANEVLGHSLDDLAKPSRTLLVLIHEMVDVEAKQKDVPIDEIFFNRRMIREYTGWTDWQVKTHIKQLEDMEYLHVRVGSKGKEYAYALNYKGQEEKRFYLNLTSIADIKKRMQQNKEGK